MVSPWVAGWYVVCVGVLVGSDIARPPRIKSRRRRKDTGEAKARDTVEMGSPRKHLHAYEGDVERSPDHDGERASR